MTYQDIIDNISSNLTGNYEHDVPFLNGQRITYKDHPLAPEILRAIGRMMGSVLPDEKKAAVRELLEKGLIHIEKTYEKATAEMEEKAYEKAEKTLSELVCSIAGTFREDRENQSVFLASELEEMLYAAKYHPEKTVTPAPQIYSRIYALYGKALLKQNKPGEAKQALEQALRYHPFAMDSIFLLCDVLKRQKDLDAYEKLCKKAISISYESVSIAKCYRNLGWYYEKKKEAQFAIALYFISISFDDHDDAQKALAAIEKRGMQVMPPDPEYVHQAFSEHSVALGADPMILEFAMGLGKRAREKNEKDTARYYFGIAYDLTGNDAIAQWIKELEA